MTQFANVPNPKDTARLDFNKAIDPPGAFTPYTTFLHYDALVKLIRSRKEVYLEESEFVHIQSI